MASNNRVICWKSEKKMILFCQSGASRRRWNHTHKKTIRLHDPVFCSVCFVCSHLRVFSVHCFWTEWRASHFFYIKLEQKCCQPQTANTCSGSHEMVAFAVELVSRFRWMTEYDIIIEASLTACCFSTWIVMRARNAFICSVTRQKK